jgi:hypothetical protein
MIINTDDEYNILVERMNRETFLSTPIFRDIHKHPAANEVLCIGVSFLTGDHYTVSISHRDAPAFTVPSLVRGLNPETLAYSYGVDVGTIADYYPPVVGMTHNLFNTVRDANRVVPMMMFNKALREYHTAILQAIPSIEYTNTYQFLDTAVATLRTIELAGLHINPTVFAEHFSGNMGAIVDGKVYTQYYPYTTTGRPSNRFGGINFAALNKHDGSRAAFTSRFAGGQLVQFDFESYHLRLLASVANITLPKDIPVHQYLAQQYFGKSTITQDEYDTAKQTTFAILYGQGIDVAIPFFDAVKVFSTHLYTEYKQHGYLPAPYSGRHIYLPGAAEQNKVFNYYVQALEFEATIGKLASILTFLQSRHSKLVLYTYDAILLDVHPDEYDELLTHIPIHLDAAQYPVRTYVGQNYHELIEIK